jgi:hypothetical protein
VLAGWLLWRQEHPGRLFRARPGGAS